LYNPIVLKPLPLHNPYPDLSCWPCICRRRKTLYACKYIQSYSRYDYR